MLGYWYMSHQENIFNTIQNWWIHCDERTVCAVHEWSVKTADCLHPFACVHSLQAHTSTFLYQHFTHWYIYGSYWFMKRCVLSLIVHCVKVTILCDILKKSAVECEKVFGHVQKGPLNKAQTKHGGNCFQQPRTNHFTLVFGYSDACVGGSTELQADKCSRVCRWWLKAFSSALQLQSGTTMERRRREGAARMSYNMVNNS